MDTVLGHFNVKKNQLLSVPQRLLHSSPKPQIKQHYHRLLIFLIIIIINIILAVMLSASMSKFEMYWK